MSLLESSSTIITDELRTLISPNVDPTTLYKLETKIGKGSFGKIWLAVKKNDNESPTKVAVKVLGYEEGNDDVNEKLIWEIKVMINSKGCEHIVQFYGGFLEQRKKHKHLWIVMEYCENGSLRHYMGNKEPFAENVIAPILKQTLLGLKFMHQSTTTHRDIKSANILWTSRGHVKLADLGEAVVLKDKIHWGEEMFTGTPYFMAPEVAQNENYNEKIDIWSVGILALELAELNPPFFNEPPFKILFQVASQILTPGLTHPENFSQEFRDFLDNCIQFDPNDRPSAEDLLNHPFIVNSNDQPLKEVAKTYYELNAPKEEPKDSKHHNSTKEVIAHVIYKDRVSGNTLKEYFDNLLKWKNQNIDLIESLCNVNVDSPRLSTSSAIKDSNSSSSRNIPIVKSDSKLRSFIKNFFKESDLQQKMEKLAILIHIAFKASSPSFGVIIADRQFHSTRYDRCFIGRELVDWIYIHLQLNSRLEATNLVYQLIAADVVIPINSYAKKNADGDRAFFRFQSAKIKEWHDSYRESQAALQIPDVWYRSSGNHEDVKPEDEEVVQMTQCGELTERDWSLIMSGANPETFKLDDVIVKEGILNRCIYRILHGSVRVENQSKVVLSTMTAGQMFGEMSVLTQGRTSATIIANSTPCVIFIAEVSFMYKLFQTEPGMQQRFFQRAAISLAKKLREVGQQQRSPTKLHKELQEDRNYSPLLSSKNSLSNSVTVDSNNGFAKGHHHSNSKEAILEVMINPRDKQYITLFNLPPTEVLIQEHQCYQHTLFKEHGQLYISSNYVCFHSKIFGKQAKIGMAIDDVDIKVNEKRLLCLTTNKRKLKLHGLNDPYAISSLICTLKDSRKASKDKSRSGLFDTEYDDILSVDDWSLLLKESKCQKYAKNEVIVKEGEWCARIHQIGKGRCRVEVEEEEGISRVLGRMETSELFGEISFLEGIRVTASVIADEDNTEIYIIEGAALGVLFERQPALCGRFYRYLAQILSSRLKEREKKLSQRKLSE